MVGKPGWEMLNEGKYLTKDSLFTQQLEKQPPATITSINADRWYLIVANSETQDPHDVEMDNKWRVHEYDQSDYNFWKGAPVVVNPKLGYLPLSPNSISAVGEDELDIHESREQPHRNLVRAELLCTSTCCWCM
jgi:hypothetical protein